jgi:hypothetical protein
MNEYIKVNTDKSYFLESFYPIVCAFLNQYKNESNSKVKRKIKEALKDTIKKYTDHKVNMVSEQVMIKCKEYGIDPFELYWTKRNIIGKVNGKSALVWEHTTPISILFNQLIEADTSEIKSIMENYSGVCWITREEDDKLNQSGYRSNRPGGWLKCYEECVSPIIYRK